MDQDLPKLCPNCHKKNVTSFSICRFCGTRYDALILKSNMNIDKLVLYCLLLIILTVSGIFCYEQIQKSARFERLAPIRESIKVANKPRLIWLYCISTNSCDGGKRLLALYNTINTIIDKRQAEYARKIDFQRLNVEDKNNEELLSILAEGKWGPVQTLTCPAIFLFSRRGEIVVEFKGEQLKGANITSAEVELDKYLCDVLLSK